MEVTCNYFEMNRRKVVKGGKVVSKVCEIYWMGICFDCNSF